VGVECRVPCPPPSTILTSFSTQYAPSFPHNPSLSLTLPPPLPSTTPIPLSTIPSFPPSPSPPPPPLFRYLPRRIELGLRRGPPPLLPPFLARFARFLRPHRPSERREQTRRRRTHAQHRREPRDSTTQSPVPLSCFWRGAAPAGMCYVCFHHPNTAKTSEVTHEEGGGECEREGLRGHRRLQSDR
jgi:hypothetical protein